jgi:hypothetical protein
LSSRRGVAAIAIAAPGTAPSPSRALLLSRVVRTAASRRAAPSEATTTASSSSGSGSAPPAAIVAVDGGALASSSAAAASADSSGSKSGGFNVLLVPVALVAAAAVALVVRKFMNREQEGEFCSFGFGAFERASARPRRLLSHAPFCFVPHTTTTNKNPTDKTEMMREIDTRAIGELSDEAVAAARARRARERAGSGGGGGPVDLDEVELPDNHPWAVRRPVSAEEEELIRARLSVPRRGGAAAAGAGGGGGRLG